MKKIGVLTFHRSINYGAYMQCMSLSHMLSEHFKDCQLEVIDYESNVMYNVYKPKLTLSYLRHPIISFINSKKYKSFKESLKYLPLSDRYFRFDGIDKEFVAYIENNYDILIVGSDAIWNWIKRGFPNPYLAKFGNKIKKLSYAASAYGMSMDYLGDKESAYLNQSFSEFDFIGVRDEYTKNMVKAVCPQARPMFTCDPTIFLDMDYILSLINHTKESFKEYIYSKYDIPENKLIIGVMQTDDFVIDKIKEVYKDNCYIIGLYMYQKKVDRYMSDINPLEWSLIFSLFDVTITNYFHGTLLSLKNNTPVISIDKTEFSIKNEGKIHDVMRRMELLDCFFDRNANEKMIVDKIDDILKNKSEYKNKIERNILHLSKSKDSFVEVLESLI